MLYNVRIEYVGRALLVQMLGKSLEARSESLLMRPCLTFLKLCRGRELISMLENKAESEDNVQLLKDLSGPVRSGNMDAIVRKNDFKVVIKS